MVVPATGSGGGSDRSQGRLFYYAMGGGHGHVLRGLAILRQLGHGTLLGPARLRTWARELHVDYHVLPDAPRAADLDAFTPDLLLVDVFPRGIVGELEALLARSRQAWLISRYVRPDYYLLPAVRRTLESRYRRVVFGEPPAAELTALAVPRTLVRPILLPVRPAPRSRARRELGVAATARLLLCIGTGSADQQRRVLHLLRKIGARLDTEVRFVSDELAPGDDVVAAFPACRLLRAADVVVAAAGYHTFHEIQAAGPPAVFLPQSRRYDDQWHRARGSLIAEDPLELERMLLGCLAAPARHHPTRAGDGAERVATMIRTELVRVATANGDDAATQRP